MLFMLLPSLVLPCANALPGSRDAAAVIADPLTARFRKSLLLRIVGIHSAPFLSQQVRYLFLHLLCGNGECICDPESPIQSPNRPWLFGFSTRFLAMASAAGVAAPITHLISVKVIEGLVST